MFETGDIVRVRDTPGFYTLVTASIPHILADVEWKLVNSNGVTFPRWVPERQLILVPRCPVTIEE